MITTFYNLSFIIRLLHLFRVCMEERVSTVRGYLPSYLITAASVQRVLVTHSSSSRH